MKKTRIDHMSTITAKLHCIFIENFTEIFLSYAGKTGNVPQFESDKF